MEKKFVKFNKRFNFVKNCTRAKKDNSAVVNTVCMWKKLVNKIS